MIAAEDVVRTHTEFNRALTMRDFDAMSKVYADDYVLVRPDGSVLSKKDVLRDLQEGGLTFTSIEIANVNVRIYGQTALLTGDTKTSHRVTPAACMRIGRGLEMSLREMQVHALTSRNHREARAHVRLVAVYVAEGSSLRLVHFQSVSLP